MALTTVPASLSATALTLTTAAQPNITSVGTLTGLTVSGNIAGTLTTAAQTNITSLGTLTSLTVDNITIDGTEIDLSSGDLTLDVAGNIILDADGAVVKIQDGGADLAQFSSGSQNLNIRSLVADKDIRLQGYDGDLSTLVTALTLDMSEAGAATFNAGATFGGGLTVSGTLNGITTTQSASGNRWGVLPEVASNGVLEIGRYLDFHATDGDTSDYGARFDYDGSKMILTSAMQIEGATTLNSNATVNGDVSVFGANRKVYVGESGSGGTFGFIGWNDASNYLYLGNSYNSAFNTDIVISSSGNVGIGTASPGAALDIETAGNTADGTYYSTITINNTGSSTYSRLRFDRSGSARWGVGLRSDDKFQIAKLFNTASDDTFVIDSSGNVGINDTPGSNSAKLAVGGAISQDPGSWAYGNLLRRLTVSGPNSAGTFTRTINISTQLKFTAHGGAFMYMLHGWMADRTAGMVSWRNPGNSSQVISDVYQDVLFNTGITVTASKGSGDLEIDLSIASAHNNSHGWYFVIWW